MLISEFVDEYNKTEDKDELFSTIVTKKYIPYVTKIDEAKRIIKTCYYKEINGKDTFVLNSPMRYIFFMGAIIEQYTNLEFDKVPDSDIRDLSKDIDLFEEFDISKELMQFIGRDINTFTTIINLVLDDEIDNNRSIIPFLENRSEMLYMAIDALGKAFESPEIKDKIVQFINNKPENEKE